MSSRRATYAEARLLRVLAHVDNDLPLETNESAGDLMDRAGQRIAQLEAENARLRDEIGRGNEREAAMESEGGGLQLAIKRLRRQVTFVRKFISKDEMWDEAPAGDPYWEDPRDLLRDGLRDAAREASDDE